MIFADTGIWFAASLPENREYLRCRALLDEWSEQLLVTDYIIDELVTLLSARGFRHVACAVGEQLWSGSGAELHKIDSVDISAAWQVFTRYVDKRWSFTDCTSYAVMQRLGITEALSLDEHFQQFGIVEVKP